MKFNDVTQRFSCTDGLHFLSKSFRLWLVSRIQRLLQCSGARAKRTRIHTHMRSLFPQSDHFYVHRCLWASGCSVMMKESILKPQITFRCGLVWFHNRLLDFSIMYCPKSCCIQSRAMLLHFGKVEMLLAIIMQH